MWYAMEISVIANGDGELRKTLSDTFKKGISVFGGTADGLDNINR